MLTVEGDISDPATAERIISGALETLRAHRHPHQQRRRLHLQAVHRLHGRRLRTAVGVNLTGFFRLTQRVIAEMLKRGGGHVVNITTTLADYANSSDALRPDLTHQGRPRLGHQVTGHRVRLPRHPGQRRLAGHHPDAGASRRKPTTRSPGSTRSDASARSATSSTASSSWSHRRSSPARSCTSTAARSPATDRAATATSQPTVECSRRDHA